MGVHTHLVTFTHSHRHSYTGGRQVHLRCHLLIGSSKNLPHTLTQPWLCFGNLGFSILLRKLWLKGWRIDPLILRSAVDHSTSWALPFWGLLQMIWESGTCLPSLTCCFLHHLHEVYDLPAGGAWMMLEDQEWAHDSWDNIMHTNEVITTEMKVMGL